MKKTISIGKQDFASLREKDCFYIDKTSFIKEWWDGEDDTTLITRPRRFGKTLNMSMLECFFSMKYAQRDDLFRGLSVWEEKKYRQLQGSYPVIFLSFAGVKEEDFESARLRINMILSDIYIQNIAIRSSASMTLEDRAFFDKVTPRMDRKEAVLALNKLSGYLQRHYGKKVIILLDEYDTPMQEAWMGGYWDEMAGFMRNFFNATFKTNPYLERAVMTGVTRVGKETMFSDLNHLNVASMTSDEYASCFGFTEKEVEAALKDYGLDDKKEEVKRWYNGFIIGNQRDIYNPWSIISFLSKKKLANYWVNTSRNALAGSLVKRGDRHLKEQFERLLNGESIECILDEYIIFPRLEENNNTIFSLLFSCGFLRMATPRVETEEMRRKYSLKLTNMEVISMFEYLIGDWFGSGNADYNDFIKALLLADTEAMNEYMNRISLKMFSSFDTGNKESEYTEPERFYHGFVLGLMVELKDSYIITSNRESGFGRYDVVLEPRDKLEKAFILEFKVHKPKKEKDLEATVEEALRQIEEKRYAEALIERGIGSDNIYSFGFAFKGKEVLIGGK